MSDQRAGRNDKCPCGSGLKYKKCCGSSFRRPQVAAILPAPLYEASSKNTIAPPQYGRDWLIRVDSQSKLDLEIILKAVQDDELRARTIGNDVYLDWEMLRPRMPFGSASRAAERFLPVFNGMLAVHLGEIQSGLREAPMTQPSRGCSRAIPKNRQLQ